MRWGWTWAVAAAVVAGTAAQAPDTKARAESFVNALVSGDPARYERMAREQFAPELLERKSSDDRRRFVEQIRRELGSMTVQHVDDANERVVVLVHGSQGVNARFELQFAPDEQHRIAGVGVQLTAGQEGGGTGIPPEPDPVPGLSGHMSSAAMGRALDAYLEPLVADDRFAGVVAIARHGMPLVTRAYGLADRERHELVRPTTRFNLASIGKLFMRAAIGQLMAEGRLSLTDTIGALLPDYPNPQAHAATVDQLLDHRAGIADIFGPAFDRTPKDQFRSNADYFRFVAPQALLFEPGTRREYCNGCYVVLGQIVERLTGVSYERFIGAHLFRPAGMTGTGFFQSDHLPPDTARGYTRDAPGHRGVLQDAVDLHGRAGSGAGGSYARAADLLAFDNVLRNGHLLDAETTAWFFGESPAGHATRHSRLAVAGGAPGANTALESDGTWTVVVLTNLDPPAAVPIARAIHQGLAQRPPARSIPQE